jgi:uncharacterized protein (DUF4415 family)
MQPPPRIANAILAHSKKTIVESSAQATGVKEKNVMKNIYNNPEQSVMESLDEAVVIEDFLPPPSELVKKTQKEKITISIDADCIRFFKIEAEKHNTKYQTMMNEVLSHYARHYAET